MYINEFKGTIKESIEPCIPDYIYQCITVKVQWEEKLKSCSCTTLSKLCPKCLNLKFCKMGSCYLYLSICPNLLRSSYYTMPKFIHNITRPLPET